MRRSTEFVLPHRRIVLAAWIVALVLGSAGAANVGSLLANKFSLPWSPAQEGLMLLHERFHERSDGAFTLVAVAHRGTKLDLAAVERAVRRGAHVLGMDTLGPSYQRRPGSATWS